MSAAHTPGPWIVTQNHGPQRIETLAGKKIAITSWQINDGREEDYQNHLRCNSIIDMHEQAVAMLEALDFE